MPNVPNRAEKRPHSCHWFVRNCVCSDMLHCAGPDTVLAPLQVIHTSNKNIHFEMISDVGIGEKRKETRFLITTLTLENLLKTVFQMLSPCQILHRDRYCDLTPTSRVSSLGIAASERSNELSSHARLLDIMIEKNLYYKMSCYFTASFVNSPRG